MSEVFYYQRARNLPSKDMVLFIFNHENDTYVNIDQVDISAPKGHDNEGRTIVTITGLGEVGPKGNGGYVDQVDFRYRRVPLNLLGLPTDGSFYDVIQGKIGFLSIVKEVFRRTGFNATMDDFEQVPFDATSTTGYVLKARADSWRFEGEINLGMPQATDVDEGLVIPPENQPIELEEYDFQTSKLISRHYPYALDLTPWPQYIDYLAPGRTLGLNDTYIRDVLNTQQGKGSLQFTQGPGPKSNLNLYKATVEYRGLIRSTDPLPYNRTNDSVIVLRPDPEFSDDAIGKLYIHFNSKAQIVRLDNDRFVYQLSLLRTAESGFNHSGLWDDAEEGTFLEDVGSYQNVANAFQAAFGIAYEPNYGRYLKVTYKGPVTAGIPLPGEDAQINVVRLETTGGVNNPFHGSTYVYYR